MSHLKTRGRRLLAVLVDHNPRCASPTPVWRTPLARLLYSAVVAYNTAHDGVQLAPIPGMKADALLTFFLNFLFVMVVLEVLVELAGLVFGTRCFHCDDCDICSLTDGIPRRALALWRPMSSIKSYGWIATSRSHHFCPTHASTVTEG